MVKSAGQIALGDYVIIYIDPRSIKCVRLEDGKHVDTRFGRFYHDAIAKAKYGQKIESANKRGFAYCLKLTPSFFTLTLSHHTQILYFHDISLVIANLRITKGSIVCESGLLIRKWKWVYDLLSCQTSRGNRKGSYF